GTSSPAAGTATTACTPSRTARAWASSLTRTTSNATAWTEKEDDVSTEQRTASERLAESVVSRAYDDVVPEAREYIKTLILDILGNAVAGASTEIGQG